MKKYFQATWTKLGFKKIKPTKLLSLVAAFYLIYVTINLVIIMAVIYWNLKIPGYQMHKGILKLFGDGQLKSIASAIAVIAIVPLLEEIIFRGIILQILTKKIGHTLGSLITALAFAFLHFPWQGVIPAFILGLIINGLFLKSKSLWATICFHILNNAVVFGLLLLIQKGVISLDSLKVF